ncbi:DUF4974 domain-containing protein [Chitinophaga sp. CC14]|uniref:FecR family protein n=1 Tax=Chitinophaga sp. CC14 TaxID=3029199 RepID=UPI003B77DF6D
MDLSTERLQHLFDKLFNGSITDAEKEELRTLAGIYDQDALLPEILEQQWKQLEPGELFSREQRLMVSQKILAQYPGIPATPVRKLFYRSRYWAAASVAVLFVVGVYSWLNHRAKSKSAIANEQMAAVKPGKNGAILKLADNSQILLDTMKNGVVWLQGGITAKIADGSLIYDESNSAVAYNVLYTPKGRQFHVVLPDGTGVWLNSSSSIRYPTAFTGGKREVEVTGEAYFEVAKSAQQSFAVTVNHQASVQVLGTSFNVSAYEDEPEMVTTLFEGKIRVRREQSSVSVLPGQQASIGKDQSIIRINENPDLDKTIAWKNGVFNFNDASLHQIMRQLERWYDIEVVYERQGPEIYFLGEISRGASLKDVLMYLQTTGVRYRMEGRTLTILN